jgi:putative drug exporter of the RND superfamily
MFASLGRLVYRLRFLVLAAWAIGALATGLLAPRLTDVGSADQASFLPGSAESMRAQAALDRAFPGEASAGIATIAFSRAGGLTDADRATIDGVARWLTDGSAPLALASRVTGVIGVTDHPELASMLRSKDGELELLQVQLSVAAFQPDANVAVTAIREHLRTAVPPGPTTALTASVTGSVGIGADYLSAIVTATDRTTLVTVVLVVLVLLLIYRAPLAALVPLLTIGASYLVASGLLALLAQAGWQVSSLLGTFVVVLVFGVGTDYTIFLVSRFREEVGGRSWDEAVTATVGRIGAVITASAATVVIGLGSMVAGQFKMFQTTGPALAIAIVVTLVAGLTLTPALLAVFGHYLFWPRHERSADEADRGFFFRLSGLIAHRPGLVAIVVLVVLGVPAIASSGMRQSFDALADLPADSEAKAGFQAVTRHFDAGRLMPITIAVDGGTGASLTAPASLAALRTLTDRLLATGGVTRVESLVAPSGDGKTPDAFRPSTQLAAMADSLAVPQDPVNGLKKLLDPTTATGLRSAASYVDALPPAYPGVATDAISAAKADLARMPAAIDELRTAARVSTQLGRIAALLSTAATAGVPLDGTSIGNLSAYLAQLVATYPDVASLPAYRDIAAALVSSVRPPDPARLAADVTGLATAFAARPDALLFPAGASADASMTTLQKEIAALSARLPGELRALSATFKARPDDLFIPAGLTGDAGKSVDQALAAYVSKDRSVTRVYATTAADPYATGAFDTVALVRNELRDSSAAFSPATKVLVGGQTAAQADLKATIAEDFLRVAALTVLGVFLVLVVLLRSFVAPVYLVGTVLLSYLCTLGLTSTVFQDLLGQAGLNNFLPLMVFVLLVAIGSDYNIFLMSRVREESDRRGTTLGIRMASARTGAVITSAGVILAGTFASMIVAPLTVLFQAGVLVAVGVLIDTFIVRTLLVPALTTIFGEAAWWPFGRHADPPKHAASASPEGYRP